MYNPVNQISVLATWGRNCNNTGYKYVHQHHYLLHSVAGLCCTEYSSPFVIFKQIMVILTMVNKGEPQHENEYSYY